MRRVVGQGCLSTYPRPRTGLLSPTVRLTLTPSIFATPQEPPHPDLQDLFERLRADLCSLAEAQERHPTAQRRSPFGREWPKQLPRLSRRPGRTSSPCSGTTRSILPGSTPLRTCWLTSRRRSEPLAPKECIALRRRVHPSNTSPEVRASSCVQSLHGYCKDLQSGGSRRDAVLRGLGHRHSAQRTEGRWVFHTPLFSGMRERGWGRPSD